VPHGANLAQARAPAWQHRVLRANDPGVGLEAELIEEKARDRQMAEQPPAGALFQGEAQEALQAS
jgi:hypothetical protein